MNVDQALSGPDTRTPAEHVVELNSRTRATQAGTVAFTKSAHNSLNAKKRPHHKPEKGHQYRGKKRHDIIIHSPLSGVVTEAELKGLLQSKGQIAWCSRVRVGGLLLLIDYLSRNLKNGMVSISADLARQYVSKLRNCCARGAIKEPLPLLCEIGILKRVRPGIHAHICASAVYRFGEDYENKQLQFRVLLPPKLASKHVSAHQRLEAGLNQRYPYRERLLRDLSALSFAPEARPLIADGMSSNRRDLLTTLVCAIDGRDHKVDVSPRGQITTSVSSCPRELRPHLLLDGKPVTDCDIAAAHWNFLPRILANRLRFLEGKPGREKYIADGWREHGRLTALLSDGDFYRAWCRNPDDDAEREEKKKLLTMLLNQRNESCQRNRLYRWVAKQFPLTLGVVEDIKCKDHGNLSIQLHRFTADAISAALLEVQGKEIPAIPLVDALICQRQHHAVVCAAIGEQIFRAAGACAKIGGLRYSPSKEAEPPSVLARAQ
jgi:hypothetical protein